MGRADRPENRKQTGSPKRKGVRVEKKNEADGAARGCPEYSAGKLSRLARLVGRGGWHAFTGYSYAALGDMYEQDGLLRTVKHRDHTRTYELTAAGRAALRAARRMANEVSAAQPPPPPKEP